MNNAKMDKAAGQAKEVLDQVTGNKKLEDEGKLEQAGASIREVAGEVADGVAGTVGKAIDSVGNAAERLKEKLSGKG
ncbi:MAG TPA: CsbD family protein [Candidatus Accumulibacter phosphatis]|nr:MAG: CsbD-like protein [Candidatus Accumulibacter sp. SK-11]HRL77085.1 CsbD family protein [Candidatus Accumulibacter phosphatis]HRQ96021.1 CsbD family protein [Candidatus Accumulibacter phosphatis]